MITKRQYCFASNIDRQGSFEVTKQKEMKRCKGGFVLIYKKIVLFVLLLSIFNLSFPHTVFGQDTYTVAKAKINKHDPVIKESPEKDLPDVDDNKKKKKKKSNVMTYVIGAVLVGGLAAAAAAGGGGGSSSGGGRGGIVDVTW